MPQMILGHEKNSIDNIRIFYFQGSLHKLYLVVKSTSLKEKISIKYEIRFPICYIFGHSTNSSSGTKTEKLANIMLMKSKQTELHSFANPATKAQLTARISQVSLH